MGRLKGCRGYLCGAMSYVDDFGAGWRERLKADLEDLGVLWLDPVNKPIDVGFEDRANLLACKRAKRAGDYGTVSSRAGIIRRVDLRMVDISDFVVVNIDIGVHTCGTYEELFRAASQEKPVIVHIDQGKANCPDWLLGSIPQHTIFTTWTEVRRYLRRVDNPDKTPGLYEPHVDVDDPRWLFFDWGKLQ